MEEDFGICLEGDEALFQKIDEDLDLSLQEELNKQATQEQASNSKSCEPSGKPLSIVDPQWELIDPKPDIQSLFREFNTQFFWGKLVNVEVSWSPKMTYRAGLCYCDGRSGHCSVRLSTPLLKLRPRSDLVETLIHEMIHAYLFVTQNNKDNDAHGPEFLSHMNRINKQTGAKISVNHSFHDEIDLYRQHWWRCDGPCQRLQPYFGFVKRCMNRPPGPRDTWWSQHKSSCSGNFIKVKEPEDFKQKGLKRKQIQENKSSANIKSFFQPSASSSIKKKKEMDTPTINSIFAKEDNLEPMRDMDTKTKGTSSNLAVYSQSSSSRCAENKLKQTLLDKFVNSPFKISGKQDQGPVKPKNCPTTVPCPVCSNFFSDSEINIHLDECLLKNA